MCVSVVSGKFVKLSRKFYFPVHVGEVIDSNNLVFSQERIMLSLILWDKTTIYS